MAMMATMGTSNDHFLGVDVGTGSVRVCVIDETGEIKGVESKEIKTWHEKADYYVLFLTHPSTLSAGGLTGPVGTIHRGHLERDMLL